MEQEADLAEAQARIVERFDCAAYGHVGSCERVFRRLAVIVVALLTAKQEAPSERELEALLAYSNWAR